MITFFISTIFTLMLFASFYYGNFAVGISTIIIETLILSCIPLIIKHKKQALRSAIEDKNNINPVININKDPWYYLVELPEISQIEAKKIVHTRKKYGKYVSIEDFFLKNMIPKDKQEKIQKYIGL